MITITEKEREPINTVVKRKAKKTRSFINSQSQIISSKNQMPRRVKEQQAKQGPNVKKPIKTKKKRDISIIACKLLKFVILFNTVSIGVGVAIQSYEDQFQSKKLYQQQEN